MNNNEEQSLLAIKCIKYNNLATLKKSFDEGANPKYVTESKGENYYHKVSETYNENIFDFLTTITQIDINHRNDNGETPLYKAISSRNIPMIKKLLDNGANPNIARNDGYTPLIKAIEIYQEDLQDTTIIDLLLDKKYKTDINLKTDSGVTPLIFANSKAKLSISLKLLENDDIDVNILTSEKGNALIALNNNAHMIMSEIGHDKEKCILFTKIMEMLIEKTKDINLISKYNLIGYDRLLEFYNQITNKSLLDFILKTHKDTINLNISFFNYSSMTNLLYITGMSNNVKDMDLLLKNGADINHKFVKTNNKNTTAFADLLDLNVKFPILKLAIENGADLSQTSTEKKNSVAHIFARKFGDDAINYFRDNIKKFNLDVENQDKVTPLMTACFLGNTEVVRILLENVKNLNARNESGNALFYTTDPFSMLKNNTKIQLAMQTFKPEQKDAFLQNVILENEKIIFEMIEKGLDVNVTNKQGDNYLLYQMKSNRKLTEKVFSTVLNLTDINYVDSSEIPLLVNCINYVSHNQITPNRQIILDECSDNIERQNVVKKYYETISNNLKYTLDYFKQNDVESFNNLFLDILYYSVDNTDSKNNVIDNLHYIVKNYPEIDFNIIDEDNNTPLIIACALEEYQVADFLISQNANPNVKNNHGDIALFYALSKGLYGIALKLAEVTDLSILNAEGKNAMDLIKEHNIKNDEFIDKFTEIYNNKMNKNNFKI